MDERQEAQPGKTSEDSSQQPTLSYTDILLFCHSSKAEEIAEAFEVEIAHAAGDLPLVVLSVGHSCKRQQGVIVLEWEGPLTDHFVHNLTIDEDILDYYLYTWIVGEDA